MAMGGALEGVRVLDLTRLLPGAFATALLADLGAEVIKVEAPGSGDPMREYEPKIGGYSAFHWVADRNKRSVVVNLGQPQGRAVVVRMAQTCDIAIESFRPGVADRLGVGESALRGANPGIVYCSMTGYGSDGPLADRAGHDVNYIGLAGTANLSGVDGQPAIPGVQMADLGGALFGVAGMLAALIAAKRTGCGDHVDISLTDAAFALQWVALATYFGDGRTPGPGAEMLTGGLPCYQIYQCADGRWLSVGALERRFWRNLCAAIDRADLEVTHSDPAAVPIWRSLFAARPRDAWLGLLGDADACCEPVNDLDEALNDPQLRHRQMVVEQLHPTAGLLPQVGVPVKLREHPGSVRSTAPILGGDTREVLSEFGFERSEIDELVELGAVQEANAARSPVPIGPEH
jgi:crotonobetainyl-CoA:carnitine CoA-transferase CaiB-like acyl-CoA transferase